MPRKQAVPTVKPQVTLTEHEIGLINKLGACFNDFCALQAIPDSPMTAEFAGGIHLLQDMVAARLAMRLHPDLFRSVVVRAAAAQKPQALR